MSNIYVLTLKTYDWYAFTDVLTASSDIQVLLDYAAEYHPELMVYIEDSAIYAETYATLVSNETPHLTILVFND